jgi:serine/threonine protein kinase
VDRYGGKIAVKKLHETYGIDDKKYLEELQIMKKLQHKNIVRLVGYCSAIEEVTSKYEGKYVVAEKRHRALCLEHMPNGNLRAILLSGNESYVRLGLFSILMYNSLKLISSDLLSLCLVKFYTV